MKKFEYREIDVKGGNIDLKSLGNDGWELCEITDSSWIFMREITDQDVHIGLLVSCAYMRNVGNLQHRTIGEFNQFVEDVMKGKLPKYDFDWNSNDAIEKWIVKFHEYCKAIYAEINLRMGEESV